VTSGAKDEGESKEEINRLYKGRFKYQNKGQIDMP
jgi:hypothetical protein